MQEDHKERFLILDGNAIIHRAYYAIPQTLITKNGVLVNAAYGFSSMLLNTINTFQPTNIVCTFDMAGPTFRHAMYKEYKGNRKKMDEMLVPQLSIIREVVKAFSIPIYEKETYEADDIIGTIAKKVIKENAKIEVVIVSGDKDILQLVQDRVEVVLPGKSFSDMIIYDTKAFENKYHFPPRSLIDFKALYGDKSDNIPGVPKIGEKTALQLLEKYKTIETVYNHIDEIKPSTAKYLEEGKEIGELSRQLATIHRAVPIEFDFKKTSFKNFLPSEVESIFLKYEFKSLISRIPKLDKSTEKEEKSNPIVASSLKDMKDDTKYGLVRNITDLYAVEEKLRTSKVFSFDIETDNLNLVEAQIVGLSLGFIDKCATYLSIKNNKPYFGVNEKTPSNKELKDKWTSILNILTNKMYSKVAHNGKFDIRGMLKCKIKLFSLYFDTMIASQLLELDAYDLKGLASLYLGQEMKTFKDLTNAMKLNINDIPIEEVGMYSCADADMTYRLYEYISELFDKPENRKLKELFFSVEMPLLPVLCQMEENGILLDTKYLALLQDEFEKEIVTLKSEIFSIVGHEFNISSPKQLSTVLFDELNLPKSKKTKTGYSTDERYFGSLGDVHPIVAPLKRYREVMKLNSTYVKTLPLLVDKDSKLHTTYNQIGTVTGRISSNNPNLQNIPVKTETGNRIRKAFIAEDRDILISFDYSQIELRIMAHMSKDPNLMNSFNEGKDIHIETAKNIFNKKDVSSKERNFAKTINFGILYGISSFGLSGQLHIPRAESQDLIDKYFQTYPVLKEYIENMKKSVIEKGYVESLYGRKRSFKGINHAGGMMKNAMLREAINMPIQGTNADMIKMAMIKIADLIERNEYKVKMVLQVHDELIFQYSPSIKEDITMAQIIEKDKILRKFCEEIKEIMEKIDAISVPIKVDIAMGKNWGELEEVTFE